ncbi:MAG: hypothetical protein JW726_15120, partial [Anaerolineales bacterium]|nr:hypothetical protein [Anaerolineales bacterium]
MMRGRKYYLLVSLGLMLLLAGCAPILRYEQPAFETWGTIDKGHNLGQTFVAKYGGLTEVLFYLKPEIAGEGTITLHLREDPASDKDVGVACMPVGQIDQERYYRFDFEPLPASQRQYYYAFLEVEGSGSVQVGLGAPSAYLEGAAYRMHRPLDAQTAFGLGYAPLPMAIGLGRMVIIWAGMLAAGIFLFILPGWALLSLLWRGWETLSYGEKLGLGGGVSLALYPLLMLWGSLVQVRLGFLYAWLPGLAAVGVIAWRNRKGLWQGLKGWRHPVVLWQRIEKDQFGLPEITLVVLLGFIFATRFWAIYDLEAPMWGDAVQHAAITQLMLDNGGLFSSWLPYAPYRSLSVQYAFSAAGALISWLSGVSAPQAVLWAGQLLNGLAVLAIYPLAVRLAKGERWAGVGAVLAAGLLSPMPAYYVNWGRYAQLAGQTVLPVALWLLWGAVESALKMNPSQPQKIGKDQRRKWLAVFPWLRLLLAGVALAGMLLNHYRMAVYYALFVVAWLLAWGVAQIRQRNGAARSVLRILIRGSLALALVALLGAILFLPWGVRLVGGALVDTATQEASSQSLWEGVRIDYQTWKDFNFYLPKPLLSLVLLAFAASLIRREWLVAAMVLWAAELASIFALVLLRVPGAHMVQSFAVLIALYIPAGLLSGWLIGQIAGALCRWGRWGQAIISIVLVLVGIWAAWGQRGISKPEDFTMVTRPDIRAMVWIREHT